MEHPEDPLHDAGDLDDDIHTSVNPLFLPPLVNPLFLPPFAVDAEKCCHGDEDEVEAGNSHADNCDAGDNMGKMFSTEALIH
ncbi:Hypothetical predicted protein [Olea europaea subsp. europaea]|uniref:Uncharacterized protein n=1 Tax=Olea europaea subsp. europaea TaxID=158383 RepID=A0A8S0QWN3_OLEEU|nr:Hypothetical predicted protein [Olea europaea subsp. europaea]